MLLYVLLQDIYYYVSNISSLCKGEITEDTFTKFLSTKKHWSNTSYNTARRYIGVLEERLREYGYTGNWKQNNKPRRAAQKLHKPFTNVEEVLDDIYQFNPKLHLCCILTYGCLLRPHQEIRQLLWGDFMSLLSQVSLSGSRTKGKRNRIIPVPEYIRHYLTGGPAHHNIFTGTPNHITIVTLRHYGVSTRNKALFYRIIIRYTASDILVLLKCMRRQDH